VQEKVSDMNFFNVNNSNIAKNYYFQKKILRISEFFTNFAAKLRNTRVRAYKARGK